MQKKYYLIFILLLTTNLLFAQIESSDTSKSLIRKYYQTNNYFKKNPNRNYSLLISFHLGNEYLRIDKKSELYNYQLGTTISTIYSYSKFSSIEVKNNKFRISIISNFAMSSRFYEINIPSRFLTTPTQESYELRKDNSFETSIDFYKSIINRERLISNFGIGYYYELFSDFRMELKGLKLLASEQYLIGKRISLDLIIEYRFPNSYKAQIANGNGSFMSVEQKFKYPFYLFVGVKYRLL